MNKLKLLLLLTGFLSLGAKSQVGQIQQIKIVSFTVKNQLPSVIDNWNNTPGALLLVAQKPPTIRVEGVRLVLQIRSNGTMICGSNASNGLPVDNFTTRTFTVNELTGLLSGCHDLKDGSYTICAQFFNIDRVAISNEVCKEFTVETPKETDYAPPTLITPESGKVFSSTDMLKPVMFRWTPLVPKPREPVTYRLKVWQLMQGQNGVQAMRTNQPIVTKDVDNITQAVVNNIYTGPCKPPYLCDFIWNVQAINREGKPVGRNNGTSEPFTFKIEEKGATGTEYAAPKLIAPENGKKFLPKDMLVPVIFRWTTVVPKPTEPVTYRIKVWQLMEGQNGMQAMNSNQPIINKDLTNITQTELSNLYTGPCKPPYLCDFVWQVQALNREGHPMGGNEGKSEVWSFMVQNNIDIEIDSLSVSCCEKGKQNIYIRVKNNLANAVNIVSIKYKINGAGAAIVLTPVSPVLTSNITGNGSKVFTSTVNCITANFLKFLVDGEDVADPDNKETEVASDTLKCLCTACDSIKIDVVQKDIKFDANGNIVLNTNISVSPKLVKNIKAELVYYEYKPESDDCMLCNKDSKTFGNFANGTHSQEWNFSPPKNLSGGTPASMVITIPPTVKCCDAVIRWCIRYVITFDDCTVCNKLICYEKKKEGCAKGNPNPNDQK